MIADEKETRTLEVSRNIALHHIYSQAGSLEKAFAEQVMNAADAGASKITIDIESDGITYRIADNGQGFPDRDSILKNFEVLGFDHTTDEELAKGRKFGMFGLGRAQLWAWSSNRWHTNNFIMEVDLKRKGLTYDLSVTEDRFHGCLIEGALNSPLSITEKASVIRGLAGLVKYAPIEVVFDGVMISKNLDQMNWTMATDDAYFLTREGGGLKVYNQGVMVCTYPASRFGISGTLVSRKNLTLNVARNDVMLNTCEVFKRILNDLKPYAEKRKSKTKLSQSDKEILFVQVLLGSIDPKVEVLKKKILQGTDSKWYSLIDLANNYSSYCIAPESGLQVAEKIHRSRDAFVFSSLFIRNCELDEDEITEGLTRIIKIIASRGFGATISSSPLEYNLLAEKHQHSAIYFDKKDIKGRNKAAWKALERLNHKVSLSITSDTYKARQLIPAEMKGAAAWTDGEKNIWISPETARHHLNLGVKGISALIMILLHEYSHDESTMSDHAHGLEFYERFHENAMKSGHAIDSILDVLSFYAVELTKMNLKIPNGVACALDLLKTTPSFKSMKEKMTTFDLPETV